MHYFVYLRHFFYLKAGEVWGHFGENSRFRAPQEVRVSRIPNSTK